MKKEIQKFVRECQVCQRNKGDIVKYLGLLYPLHILNQIWKKISMYFITGLPKYEGKDAIFVDVDTLSKYGNVCGIQSTYATSQVVEVFMKKIHRLHGLPKVIISDRDPIFMGIFWK